MSCSSPELNEIVQTSLRGLLAHCSKLKRFEITGRGWAFDHFVLDETVLQLLPQTVRDLSISVGGSLKITNLDFLRGKSLESLAVQRSFISSADLLVLVDMASSLTSLDLTSCINITSCSILSKLYNLRTLHLGNKRDLFDDDVIGICAGCRQLQRLALDNCISLTSSSLMALGLLVELEWLCLAGVSAVNDDVLLQLSNCRRIQMLDIKFCKNVSEGGLSAILNLPLLSRLEVQGVRAYSNQLLQHKRRVPKTILSDCPALLPLHLPPLPALS
ncbi:unnamed protein product [Nippostrongylus brasiliensis]|uniref:F-box/LRR-repeat protein 14 (inferred by orthology to a human protein) n=1 Tax=Nippostrongylus brasiliensis TaxID=27835 RepID=A0A158QX92_NIPBR|nr:unnamed protein product [Nippostrongylus brasiliensis]